MKKYFLFSGLLVLTFLSQARSLYNGGSIKGSVADTLKRPLPGILVSLDSTSFHTVTDINGNFYFFGIPDGNYSLVISGLGFDKKIIPVTIGGDQLTDLETITLRESIVSLDRVTVVGEMSGEARAINQTKTSPQLVTVTSSEEIARLPAKNAADVVSHNPGVATRRNKGEGHIVSIRGTPSDWSAILINGDRLPVACEENTTRSFEFEAFPADLIDHVIESRTTTPAMESDNIGGSINFITRHPEYKKLFSMNIAGGMSVLARKPTGTLNLTWGDVSKNKKFSYIINTSSYSRYYAADALKAVYGSNFHHGVNRLELRRYDGFRSTLGGNLAAEYTFSSAFKTGMQIFSGIMIDNKGMKKQSFNWFEESGQRIRLQNVYGKLNRRISGGSFYAEYKPAERIELKARIASYINEFKYGPFPHNKKDARNGLYVMEFMSPGINFTDFSKVDLNGKAVDPASQDYILVKLWGKDNPYQESSLRPAYSTALRPEDFQYVQSYTESNNTRESDPVVGQLDFEYKIHNHLYLQAGGKYRNKKGYRRISKHEWFQNFAAGSSSPILLSGFETQPLAENKGGFLKEEGVNYQDLLMPFLTPAALNGFVNDYHSRLREVYMNEVHPEYRLWVGSNYEYREQQAGTYVQMDYRTDKLNILGGLRFEYTTLHEKSDTLTDKTAFHPPSSSYYYLPEKRFTNLGYIGILPSVNTTFYLKENINLRFAASRTMHRPNFEETKPGHAVIRYNDLEYTFGNSQLRPAMSVNLDANVEYFFGSRGMWSAGSYFKKIKDHIFVATTPGVDPASGIMMKQYINAPHSWVLGFEGIFIRRFDFLKGFWNGFGISANVSYCISRMQVPGRPVSQPMTQQTPLLFNLSLLYTKNSFDSRLELGYNGSYLSQVNLAAIQGTGLIHKDSDYDIFMSEYYSLDFQFTYDFRERYSVYIEANNLLNAPEKKYTGQSWRVFSIEYYRFKAQLGLKINIESDP